MSSFAVRENPPEHIEKELSVYPEIVRHLLFHRGIHSKVNADHFLCPDYTKLGDPFLLKDMHKAVDRIIRALKTNERIAIFSDYDADGIPGGVIMHDFFRKAGFDNFENYIPDRNLEGFGLNEGAVRDLASRGAKVLITIDCGISNIREVALARELGLDVIVTDHHLPHDTVPPAYAIINPKQKGCDYPEKMLCGAGVAFKLVQGVLARDRFGIKEGYEKWFLDMVGIATLSDMVPLQGENRILAFYGLKVLRMSPRVGLMHLLRALKTDQRYLSEDDIGFLISPRINAASRMGHALPAFQMLSTKDAVEAETHVTHLNKINDERKGVVGSMVREARKVLAERGLDKGRSCIVLGNPEWKPSLLGLVCNSLMEEHGCPVFLWGRSGEGVLKGSCRSLGDVSVVAVMERVPKGIFLEFGGHAPSGGFSVSNDGVHRLQEELEKACASCMPDVAHAKTLLADRRLSPEEVTWDFFRSVEQFSPFGIDNPKPLFLLEGVKLKEASLFGKEKNHVKLVLAREGRPLEAIGFFMKDTLPLEKMVPGISFDLVASVEKAAFRGFPELRLRIHTVSL